MKKFFKVLLIILLVIVALLLLLIGYLTITEFKPEPVETMTVTGEATEKVKAGEKLSILSWNIGYAGLGKESDFFMDGGKNVAAADKADVNRYLDGIWDTLSSHTDTKLYMLQEVDIKSWRTYNIDERERLSLKTGVHALNYSCDFVPIPVPPMGMVHSGLYTTTDFVTEKAERISLPCPFSWPLSAANLKRCLLVSYLPIEGSEHYLVIVNLHLEAYDDGEGKIAQTNQLREFIKQEYDKGNYVIAGGDFNQEFPGALEQYPNEHPDLWLPGVLENDLLPDGWQFACDLSTPSCRLLNQPYDPTDTENTQYYVIDGFILSPNVKLESVKTLDVHFENSDHNPVKLVVTLEK